MCQGGDSSGGDAPVAPEPLSRIEPRHLATFVALAEVRSFRAAATRLGYVQSAVSQQTVQLERALGARLIERGGGSRGPELTPAGREFLEHARRVVNEVRAASVDIGQVT